jgi:hypothetical protein
MAKCRPQFEDQVKEPRQLVDVVRELGITITADKRELTDVEADHWTAGARAWTVRLLYAGRTLTTPFFQGPAHSQPPSAADVLHCLSTDARAGEWSFENFCSDFGYDEDSRKARATWEACKKTSAELHALLGDKFEEVADAEH